MKYAFLTGLIDFDIQGVIKNPLKVSDGILLTNNPSHIQPYVQMNHIGPIGSLELECLLGGKPVLFQEKDLSTKDEARNKTVDFMRGCQAFLSTLWSYQDNGVNFELAFAISQNDNHIHSNSLNHFFYTATRERRIFSVEEATLKKIVESKRDYVGGLKVENEPIYTYQRKESGRPNIGGTFLLQARSSHDLGVKIANYCSFFESMLSSNNVELAHQMAERAAFYLCETPQERLEHYRKSKRAYGIRSKIVHGDSVSKSQLKDIQDIAIHCDNVARELFNRVIEDKAYYDVLKSANSQDLDQFMMDKIFGIETEEA